MPFTPPFRGMNGRNIAASGVTTEPCQPGGLADRGLVCGGVGTPWKRNSPTQASGGDGCFGIKWVHSWGEFAEVAYNNMAGSQYILSAAFPFPCRPRCQNRKNRDSRRHRTRILSSHNALFLLLKTCGEGDAVSALHGA